MDHLRTGLNWGCGPSWVGIHPHWISSDAVDYGQHHVGDIRDGLPWVDETFDGIVANHSLQALPHENLDAAASELHRVLRTGGRFRVLVPDVAAAFAAYQDSDEHWPGFDAITEPWSLDRKFGHYLTWGGQNRTCFTAISLAELLDRAGFIPTFGHDGSAGDWAWLRDLDSRTGESLITEGER